MKTAFQHTAAVLLSQRLTASRCTRISSKSPALSHLLDRIAEQMNELPLKARLSFYRTSVGIVAQLLAARHNQETR